MKTLIWRARLCAAALAGTLVLSSLAGTRTVSVSSSDVAKGTVTLAFGGDAEKKILFAVRDTEDRGTSPSAWSEQRFVTVVLAKTTSYKWSVPQD